MSYFSQGFQKVLVTAKDLGHKTKDALEESKFGDKMKAAGSSIADAAKTAGVFLYDKTKNTIDDAKLGEKMKIAGSAIATGTIIASHFLVDKTKNAAISVLAKGKEVSVYSLVSKQQENPKVQQIAAVTKEGLARAGEAISMVSIREIDSKNLQAFTSIFSSGAKEEEKEVASVSAPSGAEHKSEEKQGQDSERVLEEFLIRRGSTEKLD